MFRMGKEEESRENLFQSRHPGAQKNVLLIVTKREKEYL
jgi:hypothetical protein